MSPGRLFQALSAAILRPVLGPLTPLSDLPFEAQVLSVEKTPEGFIGWVEVRGARVQVNLSLVPGVRPGDRVLVQGKVALGRVEEQRDEVHR